MKRIVIILLLLLLISTALLLGVVYISTPELAPDEMAGHWAWFAKTSLLFAISVFIGLILCPKERSINHSFCFIVSWVSILCVGVSRQANLTRIAHVPFWNIWVMTGNNAIKRPIITSTLLYQ